MRIVVCICKTDALPSESEQKGQKRQRGSDSSDAINYMNFYGGWLQEGDICQGSVLDLMVIRSHSIYNFVHMTIATLSLQVVSVKLYHLFLQCHQN